MIASERTSPNGTIAPRLAGVVVGLVLAICPLAGAHASGLIREHRYQDSYGNLVIISPGGSKRILVGRGYLLANVGPISSEPPADRVEPLHSGCSREPVLLHGRSYMYGLPDNVVPVPAGICR